MVNLITYGDIVGSRSLQAVTGGGLRACDNLESDTLAATFYALLLAFEACRADAVTIDAPLGTLSTSCQMSDKTTHDQLE